MLPTTGLVFALVCLGRCLGSAYWHRGYTPVPLLDIRPPIRIPIRGSGAAGVGPRDHEPARVGLARSDARRPRNRHRRRQPAPVGEILGVTRTSFMRIDSGSVALLGPRSAVSRADPDRFAIHDPIANVNHVLGMLEFAHQRTQTLRCLLGKPLCHRAAQEIPPSSLAALGSHLVQVGLKALFHQQAHCAARLELLSHSPVSRDSSDPPRVAQPTPQTTEPPGSAQDA